jgi:hypothetical protein
MNREQVDWLMANDDRVTGTCVSFEYDFGEGKVQTDGEIVDVQADHHVNDYRRVDFAVMFRNPHNGKMTTTVLPHFLLQVIGGSREMILSGEVDA